jgi:hypothetical protein
MTKVGDVVRPEGKRDPNAPDDATKDCLRPRSMTNHAIDPYDPQQVRQRLPRRPHRMRPARSHGWQLVHTPARRNDFAREPLLKTQRKLVNDALGTPASTLSTPSLRTSSTSSTSSARDRHQNRLDPAIEISAVDMENAHQTAAAASS